MTYLVVLSGVLTILGAPFKLPEIDSTTDVEKAQVSYRVTACFCSLFSLIGGSRPFILEAIAGRIQRLLTPREAAGPGGRGQDGGADQRELPNAPAPLRRGSIHFGAGPMLQSISRK